MEISRPSTVCTLKMPSQVARAFLASFERQNRFARPREKRTKGTRTKIQNQQKLGDTFRGETAHTMKIKKTGTGKRAG